ncbi:MAG: O-antigen ligase family protein [Hyphomicrobiaceae bacterium]
MGRTGAIGPQAASRQTGITWLALTLVWLAATANAVVFTEPAPVDLLSVAVIAVLPICGLASYRPPIAGAAVLLAIMMASAYVAISQVTFDYADAYDFGGNFQKAIVYNAITTYLCLFAIVIAAFVALSPVRHGQLLLSGLICAGVIAGTAGILGYFDVPPGAASVFTLHGRASGTFKDPNVLGGFLVVPLVLCAHLALHGRSLTRVAGLCCGIIVALAVLLTFSRGAWLSAAFALSVFGFLTFTTAKTNRERITHALGLILTVAILGAALAVTALTSDDVAAFLEERAQAVQSYDEGPEGRFGGQLKALDLISEHPLGLGALQFSPRFHMELPHNVFLNRFLSTGWIGGFAFTLLVLALLTWGFGHALRPVPHQKIFQAFFAAFVGTVMLGLLVDIDHWRHLYLLMGVILGAISHHPTTRFVDATNTNEAATLDADRPAAPAAADLALSRLSATGRHEPRRAVRLAGHALAPRATPLAPIILVQRNLRRSRRSTIRGRSRRHIAGTFLRLEGGLARPLGWQPRRPPRIG